MQSAGSTTKLQASAACHHLQHPQPRPRFPCRQTSPALAWRAKQCIGVGPPRSTDHRCHRGALLAIQPLPPALLYARCCGCHIIGLRLQPPEPPQDCLADAAAGTICDTACACHAICCIAAASRRTTFPAISRRRPSSFPRPRRQPAGLGCQLLVGQRLDCRLHAARGASIKAGPHMHQAIKMSGLWKGSGGSSQVGHLRRTIAGLWCHAWQTNALSK